MRGYEVGCVFARLCEINFHKRTCCMSQQASDNLHFINNLDT